MSKNNIWVSNTSPLIFLSHIDRLDILCSLAQIWIPKAVLEEITDQKTASNVKKAYDSGKILVKSVGKMIDAKIDMGEKAAISLAIETQPERILLDDDKARRIARRYSLNPLGTLGLLLAGKQAGLIPAVRPEIDKLLSLDRPIRATPELIEAILKEAGE